MNKKLEDLGLPASVLSLLEGFPAQPPSFPGNINTKEEERIIPGGPSSSELLKIRENSLQNDLASVVQEVVRVRQKVSAATNLLQGLSSMQGVINSALTKLKTSSGSISSLVDFYNPGAALLNASLCSYESLYGQVTLPYSTTPQSQLRRIDGYGARPGTVVRFIKIPSTTATNVNNGTFNYDESDPQSFYAVDGRLDSAWSVPINASSENLLISVKLPPTLGNNSQVNALSIIPWPLYGATISEVWIRNGNISGVGLPGWNSLNLSGQLGYNTATYVIESAGAHRFLFSPSPVQEILIRLKSQGSNLLGIVNLDCFAINFTPVGSVIIDASQLGLSSVASVSLAGLNPSSLSRLPVNRNGTQITINLSSATIYDTPVLTSVSITPVPSGQQDTGFNYNVFSP